MKPGLIVAGVIGGTLLLSAGLAFLGSRPGSPAKPIDDVMTACVQHTGAGMHIHPRLSIVIRGEEQEVPQNTGIVNPRCMRPIHTHDEPGILHLEFPVEQDVRLGQFFQIWGKTFSRDCILDRCNGPEGTVKFFVNGQENATFDQYVMRDGDRMEIRYE